MGEIRSTERRLRRDSAGRPGIAGKKQTDFGFEAPISGPIRHSKRYPGHFKPTAVRGGLPEALQFHDRGTRTPPSSSPKALTRER